MRLFNYKTCPFGNEFQIEEMELDTNSSINYVDSKYAVYVGT